MCVAGCVERVVWRVAVGSSNVMLCMRRCSKAISYLLRGGLRRLRCHGSGPMARVEHGSACGVVFRCAWEWRGWAARLALVCVVVCDLAPHVWHVVRRCAQCNPWWFGYRVGRWREREPAGCAHIAVHVRRCAICGGVAAVETFRDIEES